MQVTVNKFRRQSNANDIRYCKWCNSVRNAKQGVLFALIQGKWNAL